MAYRYREGKERKGIGGKCRADEQAVMAPGRPHDRQGADRVIGQAGDYRGMPIDHHLMPIEAPQTAATAEPDKSLAALDDSVDGLAGGVQAC